VKVQGLTLVFGVIEILDLNVGPETALMIRVFCFARSFQANGEWYVTYAENDSFFVSSVVLKPGRYSSVGIITRYGLDGPGDRISLGGGGGDFLRLSRSSLGPT
jgi:hypothetical protein